MVEYENVEPNVWKPTEDGDAIEGILKAKNTDVGVNKSNTYYIEKEGGEQFMVWGSTVLDDRMQFVNVGNQIKITYKGTQKNKRGQDTKIFVVGIAKSMVAEPGTTEEKQVAS